MGAYNFPYNPKKKHYANFGVKFSTFHINTVFTVAYR